MYTYVLCPAFKDIKTKNKSKNLIITIILGTRYYNNDT